MPFLETENCRGCAKCAAAESCPVNAYRRNGKKPIRDEALCTNCGRCIGKCRFGAVTEAASGYKVYIGGRWGKRTRLGTPFGRLPKSEEEVLTMIEKVLLYFRENAEKGERFAVMIDRIGVEKVFEALDADDVLSRKREILDRVI